MSEKQERGNRLVRQIFGDEIAENRNATKNAFNADMRELTDLYCFGDVWSRQGLKLSTRSMLVIAMLAVLGKSGELESHVKGAIRNGCTPEEIKEVLLMVAIYAGVPAGIGATRVAEKALDDIKVDDIKVIE